MTAFFFPMLALLAAGLPVREKLNETVNVYRNLDFAVNDGVALQLDLYVPAASTTDLPCIVVIPGGGFLPQTSERFAAAAQRFAEAGFAAASIGYRGRPANPFPAAVHDAKAAVRYLRANAADFKIDPARIGAFGQSAGAHLVGMLAVTDNPALEGDGGNPSVSSRIAAAVCFAGVFDFMERFREDNVAENTDGKRRTNGEWIGEPFSTNSALWRQASPYHSVNAGDAPILFVHCKDDNTVRWTQSQRMYDALKPVQPASRLLVFEKGGHGVLGSPIVRDAAWSATIEYFQETLVGPDATQVETAFVPAVPPTHANVHYGPHARNLMDVWTVNSAAPAPVLVSIHGGGFRKGDKKISNRLLRECLASGIAVVTITYRFSDDAIAPACFLDSARAIQFVRENAVAWNIDPKRVAATGGSAGAGMSLWLGFHDDLADATNSDPVLRQSTRLTCMAVDNGQTSYDPRFIRDLVPEAETYLTTPIGKLFDVDLKALDTLPEEKYRLFESVSPINFISPDDPPVLLTYSSALDTPIVDRSIGIHHPRFGYALKEKMDALGIPCTVVPGLDGKDEERADHIMAFLKKRLGVDE